MYAVPWMCQHQGRDFDPKKIQEKGYIFWTKCKRKGVFYWGFSQGGHLPNFGMWVCVKYAKNMLFSLRLAKINQHDFHPKNWVSFSKKLGMVSETVNTHIQKLGKSPTRDPPGI